jgi:hypothetical protein
VRRVRAFKREKSRRGQDGGRKNVHLEESVWLFFVNAPVCESLCFFGYEKRIMSNHVVLYLKTYVESVGY